MSLPPYVLKGVISRAKGSFVSTITSGLNIRSVVTGIVASTTHTLAGATQLTAETNIISTCATIADSVKLPVMVPGHTVDVFNAGAAAAAVYPGSASGAIDGGSAGAAVTLSAGKRARFFCTAPNVVVSAQYGVASA